MLANLARWCVRRRRLVVFGIWLPLLILLIAVSSAAGSSFRTDFTLPDSEAADVQTLLEDANPDLGGETAQIVFETSQGVNDDSVRAPMTAFFEQVDALDNVSVLSPYDGDGQISDDGSTAFAQLQVTDLDLNEYLDLSDEIQALGEGVDAEGVTIEYGGTLFAGFEMPESELLGVIAAVIILILAFGSVLAMGLPIGTALFGLGVGTSIVALMSHAFSMPDFTTQMVAMIGLGVGIDYALFIVTRYREGLHRGLGVEDSIVESIDTAGRAVMFAGVTVIISLLGLYMVGLGFVRGLATGAAVGVLMMMLGSVTLLPALLGMVGRRIGITTWAALAAVGLVVVGAVGWIISGVPVVALAGVVAAVVLYASSFRFFRGLRTEVPHRVEKPVQQTFWYRWSHFVQRRPWPILALATGILVLLAIPLFSIRLGFGDTGNLPEDQTARRAYDLLADGFGEGVSGPLIVTVEGGTVADEAALAEFGRTLSQTEGVAFVQPPEPIGDQLAVVTVFPDSSPQDVETADLVQRLRDEIEC